jgi:predicted HTH domain antitoxin
MTILIRDEYLNGAITNEFEIELTDETISAKELIAKRVIQEVENYNSKLPEYFVGLVEPIDAEKTLNGYKLKKVKRIDPEEQVYVALDAFQKNAFFILIDNRQIEDLDHEIKLSADSAISFVKLTPLVGG